MRLQAAALMVILSFCLPADGKDPSTDTKPAPPTAKMSKAGTHTVVKNGVETKDIADRFIHARIATDATRAHTRAQDTDDPFDEPGVGAEEYAGTWLSNAVKHIPAGTINSATLSNAMTIKLQALGVFIDSTAPYRFNLDKGNVVFMPEEEVVLSTREGDVHIAPGSVALIMQTSDALCIYDLHDGHKGGVKIYAEDQKISLVPGRQILLSSKADAQFKKLNPAPQIAHCNPVARVLSKNLSAFTANFSILSALLQVKPLQSMLDSNQPEDQKLTDRLIKNAIILADMNSPQYRTGSSD